MIVVVISLMNRNIKKYETTVVLSTIGILHDSSRDSSSISVNNKNVVKPKKNDNFFEKICLYILNKILSLNTHVPIPTSLHCNHHSIVKNKNSSIRYFGSYDKIASISKVIVINYYFTYPTFHYFDLSSNFITIVLLLCFVL